MTEIENNLRQGLYKNNPHKCAEDKARLAGEYSFLSSQLESILARKASTWLKLRETNNTDKACDRAYEKTEDGINEMGLKLRLKSIDKMTSSLSSLIKIAEGEARNLY